MLERNLVEKRLSTRGWVCVADDFFCKAVRIVRDESGDQFFIKPKGHDEVRSTRYYISPIVDDCSNREITLEEYYEF
jgi:hypothetical protein